MLQIHKPKSVIDADVPPEQLIRDRGTGAISLRALRLASRSGPLNHPLEAGHDALVLDLKTEGNSEKFFAVELILHNELKQPLFLFAPHLRSNEPAPLIQAGRNVRIELPIPSLASGSYHISIQLVRPMEEVYAHYVAVAMFEVHNPLLGLRGWTFAQNKDQGCLLLDGRCWSVS